MNAAGVSGSARHPAACPGQLGPPSRRQIEVSWQSDEFHMCGGCTSLWAFLLLGLSCRLLPRSMCKLPWSSSCASALQLVGSGIKQTWQCAALSSCSLQHSVHGMTCSPKVSTERCACRAAPTTRPPVLTSSHPSAAADCWGTSLTHINAKMCWLQIAGLRSQAAREVLGITQVL